MFTLLYETFQLALLPGNSKSLYIAIQMNELLSELNGLLSERIKEPIEVLSFNRLMSLTNINTGNQGLEKNIKNGDRDLSQLLKSKNDTANVGLGNVFANIVT